MLSLYSTSIGYYIPGHMSTLSLTTMINMIPLLRRPLQLLPRRAIVTAAVPVLRHGFATSSSVQSEAQRPGVAAALDAAQHGLSSPVKPHLFEEFSLTERVAVVSGANRGLGLEMSLALAEAGARVYALDLPPTPGEEFRAVQKYVKAFGTGAKLEYVDGGVDVTDQKKVWNTVAKIGDMEGRMDVGVAAAGILHGAPTLEYDAEDFQKVSKYLLGILLIVDNVGQVMNVNTNGVLYTAQAVGRQMERFKLPGSIILIASMSGSITNRVGRSSSSETLRTKLRSRTTPG